MPNKIKLKGYEEVDENALFASPVRAAPTRTLLHLSRQTIAPSKTVIEAARKMCGEAVAYPQAVDESVLPFVQAIAEGDEEHTEHFLRHYWRGLRPIFEERGNYLEILSSEIQTIPTEILSSHFKGQNPVDQLNLMRNRTELNHHAIIRLGENFELPDLNRLETLIKESVRDSGILYFNGQDFGRFRDELEAVYEGVKPDQIQLLPDTSETATIHTTENYVNEAIDCLLTKQQPMTVMQTEDGRNVAIVGGQAIDLGAFN